MNPFDVSIWAFHTIFEIFTAVCALLNECILGHYNALSVVTHVKCCHAILLIGASDTQLTAVYLVISSRSFFVSEKVQNNCKNGV